MRPTQAQVLAVVAGEHQAPHSRVLHLRVPEDLWQFDGHFAQYPILPGVVQVDWAWRLASAYLPICGAFHVLSALKFCRVVRPGMHVQLHLTWTAPRLSFSYYEAGQLCSEGRIDTVTSDQTAKAAASA